MYLAWLKFLRRPGLIPLVLPSSPGSQFPSPPEQAYIWAPFLMRQETLKEYKSLPCNAGDGRRRDKTLRFQLLISMARIPVTGGK